jgi:hypothetical protein
VINSETASHHPGEPQDHQDAPAPPGRRFQAHRDRSFAGSHQDHGDHQLLPSKFDELEATRSARSTSGRVGRRRRAGRDQAGQGLHRHQAQAPGRRQDGRPPRKQGRRRQDRAEEDMPLPSGRHADRDLPQSARGAFAHERRTGARDPPRAGPARSSASRSPRRSSTASGSQGPRLPEEGRSPDDRQERPLRRAHRRANWTRKWSWATSTC